jgi:hypothetical protein
MTQTSHLASLLRLPALLLALYAAILAYTHITYVGDLTLYSGAQETARAAAHDALVHNQSPVQGWNAIGGDGINIRIAVPYAVEAAHRYTGVAVGTLYKATDLLALWVTLLLLFVYLRRWFEPTLSLLAITFVAALLPLTFAFHYYHPWDRAGLLAWLLALFALRDQRWILFACAMLVAMLIKYDAIVLPILYFLAHARRDNWPRILRETLPAVIVALGSYVLLRALLPGGSEARDIFHHLARNSQMLLGQGLSYPPLLAFLLPAALTIAAWSQLDRFMRSCVLFVLILVPLMFATTNFEEVRAEQIYLLLLMPATLRGVQRLS